MAQLFDSRQGSLALFHVSTVTAFINGMFSLLNSNKKAKKPEKTKTSKTSKWISLRRAVLYEPCEDCRSQVYSYNPKRMKPEQRRGPCPRTDRQEVDVMHRTDQLSNIRFFISHHRHHHFFSTEKETKKQEKVPESGQEGRKPAVFILILKRFLK